jgi:lipopolysaccharide export system permease protein
MKRLDRYVIREILPTFMMGVLIVVVMFQVNFYMALGKNDLTRNVPPLAILKIIFLETPGFLTMTLPISVSLATSLAMSRIARESELTALRTAGAKVLRVMWPTALFGGFIGLVNLWVIDQLAPVASKKSYELQTSAGVLSSVGTFLTNVPLRLQNYTVSLGSVVNNKNETLDLKDVLMVERPQSNQLTIVTASSGTYRQGVWRFKDAVTFLTSTGSTDVITSKSKEMVINQKISIPDILMPPSPQQLGVRDLKKKIAELKQLGQYTRNLEIEYYIKYSTPSMCLIFAIVSPIFAIKFARQGGFVGVVIGMAIVMLYFNAYVICTQIIGKNPAADPLVVAWLPNILFLIAGIIGLRSLE